MMVEKAEKLQETKDMGVLADEDDEDVRKYQLKVIW
jgi:hypothetical protein